MPATELDRRFGNIAMDKGWVTIHELLEAISIQVKGEVISGNRKPVGTILCEQGQITKEQLEAILKEMGLA